MARRFLIKDTNREVCFMELCAELDAGRLRISGITKINAMALIYGKGGSADQKREIEAYVSEVETKVDAIKSFAIRKKWSLLAASTAAAAAAGGAWYWLG